MQSVPDFVDEMAIRLRTLRLLVGKHFTTGPITTCADVARATEHALTELSTQGAQLTTSIDQQLRRAYGFANAADYLEGLGTDLTDVSDELRRAIQVSATSSGPADKAALCRKLRDTHSECAEDLAAQRVYLERALSTARMAIDDGRIATLHALVKRGEHAAVALLTAAYRDREARLQQHKATFNGAGLAQQIKIEQERERQRELQRSSMRSPATLQEPDDEPLSASATDCRSTVDRVLQERRLRRGTLVTKGAPT